ncbi:FxsB family cyclophane-forming radical SAM/SPASM peptide maturase [Micromonospora sp. CPCC 206061]|uniref:FxsB family cyclophane-forming radical SAM/SPASM peptide maturase n=1 Tax=Micromonospora sp. CPCC 206061 TaxID=3122410 RepID=UPI002FEFD5A3
MRYFVLKVHSRCDLACDHCYVYEHADQSWRTRPRTIALETVRAAGKRIAEHAATHALPGVQVILHGGEPLLLGADRLDAVLAELRAAIAPVVRLDLRMQTNAVLLSPAICDVLLRHGVRVGVSLDGDRSANDRHRRFASGASSHPQVLRGLALLRQPAYRQLYAGILCTVDVAGDPVAVYEALLAEAPPRVDFLLPHATWDQPPPRPAGSPTPYADWLGRIHDRWTDGGRPMPIRLFDALSSTVAYATGGTEAVGLAPADVVVIETDGAWEQADSLKTAYDGAPATGFDVFSHSVDDVAGHAGVAARQNGLAGVCATCRACPVVRRCGGGLFAHRYRSGSGFDNPSVYCADLKALIARIDESPVDVSPAGPGAIADGSDRNPMSDRLLDEIGSGYGDAAAIARLVESQVLITRVLLSMVGETEAASPAWELLEHVDAEAPEAVAEVLAHPYARTWAVRYLEEGEHRDTDRRHLACVAAAAAVRAGLSVELALPVRDGLAHLPTLGAFAVASRAAKTAELSVSGGEFELRTGAEWWPTRWLDAEGERVPIDDTDAYRDCHEWPVAGRLTPAAVDSWQGLLSAAWQGIHRDAPAHSPAVRAAFRALVPLVPDPGGRLRSATNRDAFGAVAVAEPADGDALALLLVHEVQHVKLGAVLDRYDLVDSEHRELLPVPWRPIKRPAEAVLQGAYAHLAVADVWRARSRGSDAAAEHYHRYLGWVTGALGALHGTGALTADGERFTHRMRETVEKWRDDHR